MRNFSIFCFLIILTKIAIGQKTPKAGSITIGPKSIFIMNDQKVKPSDLAKYNPDSVTTMIVLNDSFAIKLYGDSAKYGVCIIETRSFARSKFISFFRNSSKFYDSLITAIGSDSSFTYIINGKVQEGNYEGNLSAINEDAFLRLEILTKEQLYTKYRVNDKQFGIQVYLKKSKN